MSNSIGSISNNSNNNNYLYNNSISSLIVDTPPSPTPSSQPMNSSPLVVFRNELEKKEEPCSRAFKAQSFLDHLQNRYGAMSFDSFNKLLLLELFNAFGTLVDQKTVQESLLEFSEVHMKHCRLSIPCIEIKNFFPTQQVPLQQQNLIINNEIADDLKRVQSICEKLSYLSGIQEEHLLLLIRVEDTYISILEDKYQLPEHPFSGCNEALTKWNRASPSISGMLKNFSTTTLIKNIETLQEANKNLQLLFTDENLKKVLANPEQPSKIEIEDIQVNATRIQSHIDWILASYSKLLESLKRFCEISHEWQLEGHLITQLEDKDSSLTQKIEHYLQFCNQTAGFTPVIDKVLDCYLYFENKDIFKPLFQSIHEFLRKGYPKEINQQILDITREIKIKKTEQYHKHFIDRPLSLFLCKFKIDYLFTYANIESKLKFTKKILKLSQKNLGETSSVHLNYYALLLFESSSFLRKIIDTCIVNKIHSPLVWLDELNEKLSLCIVSLNDNRNTDLFMIFAINWRTQYQKLKEEKSIGIELELINTIIQENQVFHEILMDTPDMSPSFLFSSLNTPIGQESKPSSLEKTFLSNIAKNFLKDYSCFLQQKHKIKILLDSFLKSSIFKNGEFEEYRCFLKHINNFISNLNFPPAEIQSLDKQLNFIFTRLRFNQKFLITLGIKKDLALIKNPVHFSSTIISQLKLFHKEKLPDPKDEPKIMEWVPLFNAFIQSFSNYPLLHYLLTFLKNIPLDEDISIPESIGSAPVTSNNSSKPEIFPQNLIVEKVSTQKPLSISNNNNDSNSNPEWFTPYKARVQLQIFDAVQQDVEERTSSSDEETPISDPSPLALIPVKKNATREPITPASLINVASTITSKWAQFHLKKMDNEHYHSYQTRQTIFTEGIANILGYLAELSEGMERPMQDRLDGASTHCRALSDNAFLYLEQALKIVIAYFDIPSQEEPQKHILLCPKEAEVNQRPLRYDHNIHSLFTILREFLNINILKEIQVTWLQEHKEIIQKDLRYPATQSSPFSQNLYQINQLTQLKQWMKQNKFPPTDRSVADHFGINVDQKNTNDVISDIKKEIKPLFEEIEKECLRAISIANTILKISFKHK